MARGKQGKGTGSSLDLAAAEKGQVHGGASTVDHAPSAPIPDGYGISPDTLNHLVAEKDNASLLKMGGIGELAAALCTDLRSGLSDGQGGPAGGTVHIPGTVARQREVCMCA